MIAVDLPLANIANRSIMIHLKPEVSFWLKTNLEDHSSVWWPFEEDLIKWFKESSGDHSRRWGWVLNSRSADTNLRRSSLTQARFLFQSRDDAMLFKLTWGGQ